MERILVNKYALMVNMLLVSNVCYAVQIVKPAKLQARIV